MDTSNGADEVSCTDINTGISYWEKYAIKKGEYDYVPIPVHQFSTRVQNRFLSNDISTVGELIERTPSDLMEMDGFGKRCLDEIELFCANLKNTKPMELRPLLFYNYKDDIFKGDFSRIEECTLTENERKLVKKFKCAYGILGKQIVSDCANRREKVNAIIGMIDGYKDKLKLEEDINSLITMIPVSRRSNKASAYIDAYTLDKTERCQLKKNYESENSSLVDMKKTQTCDEAGAYIQLKRFLIWCTFNMQDEIDDLFRSAYKNEQTQIVIQLRANNHTLKEIGLELGVSRERVRQIENSAKKMIVEKQYHIKLMLKIVAELNGKNVIEAETLRQLCGDNTNELRYLLSICKNECYIYDEDLNIFIVEDASLPTQLRNYINGLPKIIKHSQLDSIAGEAEMKFGIRREAFERSFCDSYRSKGKVYYRGIGSEALITLVLEKYYPDGIRVYDNEVISEFRKYAFDEFGDIGLPENDGALKARIIRICILCDRGKYKFVNKRILPVSLEKKICHYIDNSEKTIFLMNTLFYMFNEELCSVGIANKYFLQGVLHKFLGDRYFFSRDYLSKSSDTTSFYSAILDFIKKSDYPVSKSQIQEEFPGITEIVISLSVTDPNIIKFFGEYLHASKLKIQPSEKAKMFSILENLVSDGKTHHIKDAYDLVANEIPEALERNAAMNPFRAYSVLEFVFRDEFQFSRPYIAQNGVEIGRAAERLHDLVYSRSEILVKEIIEFSKENHFQITSLLEFINSCNDEFVLANKTLMVRTDYAGINKEIAKDVDEIIANAIDGTLPISKLSIWGELPTINLPWTDWLVYSTIKKWGKKAMVSTSSNQFKLSVPIISPIGKYTPIDINSGYMEGGNETFAVDDLDDIDLLLEDIIDETFLSSY